MKQTSLYERKSATMRRKFYFGKQKTIFQNSFLRHPKFQDLEKNKKTKRTKKNIISELFLETPQIPRPLENWFVWFFCFFLVFCKTSGKLFLLVFEESIADVHPRAFAEIISFENFIEE